MILRQLLRLSALLVMFGGCGEPIAPPTPVATVEMTQDTATLVPGATLTLSASPLDAQGKPLMRTISWASSNSSVASVAGGEVTALAVGSTVISATAMGITGQTQVVVKPGAVLGPSGATLNLLGGRVVMVVPAGAVSVPTQIIVDSVTPLVTSSRLVAGTSYSIEAPSAPAQPFSLSLSYDPANVKTGAPQSALKIYALKATKWDRVPSSAADPVARTVTAPISTYGVYAVLEQAPGTGTIFSGNGQTGVVGASVAVKPSVRVMDVEGFPVPGIQVVFTVTGGNGSATGATTTTDANGTATVGDWMLGSVVGANTLTASFTSAGGSPLQFTATGIPGPPASMILDRGDNQRVVVGRGVQESIRFRVLDAFGNGVPSATVNFTASEGSTLAHSNATTLADGYVLVPGWTVGPSLGAHTVTATVTGVTVPSATVTVHSVKARVVTFGDSNTDLGFQGTSAVIRVASYVSFWPERLSPSAPNSALQLAGKIETHWAAGYGSQIDAINHGISETTTGSVRSTRGAPGARTVVGGFSRFDAEILGNGFPWLGGEPAGDDYPGPLTRVRSYIPTSTDFAYVSMGTNDAYYLIQPLATLDNLRWMADRWINDGLPAKHFFLTTLPPNASGYIPEINRGIRSIAAQTGVQLIDIAAFTSNDDGLTWKETSMHVGDFAHYSESVRDWIAGQVVAKMAAVTAPPN